MRMLLFMPSKDFSDESVAMVRLFFDRWGVAYDIASYGKADECRGSHGAVHERDADMARVAVGNYDGIVLCDGEGIEAQRLYEYRPLLDAVLILNGRGRHIIAIGNAVKILARANVIKGRRIATDGAENENMVLLFHGTPSPRELEISGNIITMRGARSIEHSMERVLKHMNVA